VYEGDKIRGFFLQNDELPLGFLCHVELTCGTDRSENVLTQLNQEISAIRHEQTRIVVVKCQNGLILRLYETLCANMIVICLAERCVSCVRDEDAGVLDTCVCVHVYDVCVRMS
jgi:hypothetical protein